MAATKKALNPMQLEFIFDNVGRMKQKDIAAHLQVSPACINKIIHPKAKVVLMDNIFDIDKEARKYGYL